MSVRARIARCPAKVNLSLRVLGRRDDGHHDLDTVFQAIDLWDEIEASESDSLSLACDDPDLPVDESNLVLRAAQALRAATDTRRGATLFLRKRIPVAGGLGGGSSDAAGALLLLREVWSLPVGEGDLHQLAARLGADVPFFLSGGTARGTGKGDRIERLTSAGPLPILVGVPPFGIPTGEVYRRYSGRLTPPGNGVRVRRFSALKLPGLKDFSLGVNDLEAVVFEGWPELTASLALLRERGAVLAMVSGSGSSVFGVFEQDERRNEAAAGLRSELPGWSWIPTRAVDCGAEVLPAGDGGQDRGPKRG